MFIPAASVIDWQGCAQDLASFLPGGRVRYLANGRSAIYSALADLDVPCGTVALLPAYLCDSVAAPFHAYGCNVTFFPVDCQLRWDLDVIERLIRTRGASVLLVIHYFGFPAPGLAELKRLCLEWNVILIEDCAHALFSRDGAQWLGSRGDASVFSLRKSLAVPEGGVLVTRGEPVTPAPAKLKLGEGLGLLRELLYWGEFQVGASLRSALLGSDSLRAKLYAMDSGRPVNYTGAIGRLSALLASRVDPGEVVLRRRANFRYWIESHEWIGKQHVALFQQLPEGVCPAGFPILIDNRDELRRQLYRAGVALRTFWDALPMAIDEARFPDSIYLRDRILVLPVHQSLRQEHLDAVREALQRC